MKNGKKVQAIIEQPKPATYLEELATLIVEVANSGAFANKSVAEVAAIVDALTAVAKLRHGITE